MMKTYLSRFIIIFSVLLLTFSSFTQAQENDNCSLSLSILEIALSNAETAAENEDLGGTLDALETAQSALDIAMVACIRPEPPSTATVPVETTSPAPETTPQQSACEANIRSCFQIESVLINGNLYSDGDTVTISSGTLLTIEGINYTLSAQNLAIIDQQHDGLSYVLGYAFPRIDERWIEESTTIKASTGDETISRLVAETGTLFVSGGADWIVTPEWSRLNILVLHETPLGSSIEKAIGQIVILLDVQ